MYRKYFSPIKGYTCAHHSINRKGSCSDWALNILETKGAFIFFIQLPERRECNAANRQIRSKANEKEEGDARGNIDRCCIPAEIASCWILGP